MMNEQVEVAVKLVNDKVQFTGVAGSNPPVRFDYKPPAGDGQGYTGLEMLLMSLAACSGTTIVYLLRKMGKHVSGLTVNGQGIRRNQHPTSFEKMSLAFVLCSKDATDQDMQEAIRLAEQSICPVWAMLKNGVEIVARHSIVG